MKTEMICVEEIKTVLIDQEQINLAHCNHDNFCPVDDPKKILPLDIVTELVKGRIFINNDGKRICIGMSKQVQEAIGLPFEVFDNQQEKIKVNRLIINRLRNCSVELQKRLGYIETMGFFKRIKYLFSKRI